MTIEIRNAHSADRDAFLLLWKRFIDGYRIVLKDGVSDFTWHRLMDPASKLTARIACLDGKPVGFAIHQHHPSTWVMGMIAISKISSSLRKPGARVLVVP